MGNRITYEDMPEWLGRLGKLIRKYTTDEEARRRDLNFGLFFSGCGAIVLLGGFALMFAFFKSFGPAYRATAVIYSLIPAVLLAGFFAKTGLPALLSAYRTRQMMLGIFERGFAVLENNELTVFRWTDVVDIYKKVETSYHHGNIRTTRLYRIDHKAGMSIWLDDCLQDIPDIIKIIGRHYAEPLYRAFRRKIDKNQTVTFGPVALTATGIDINGKHFRWEKVKVTIDLVGDLKFEEKDGGFFHRTSVHYSEVPNCYLLIYYLSRVVIISYKDEPDNLG